MTDDMRELRKKALRARRKLTTEQRVAASEKICSKVTSSREFRSASLVACYLPMRDEVDTRTVIARAWRANKRIFVPVMRGKHEMFFREIRPDSTVRRNSMMIWEPDSGAIVSPRELQLVVTPTVAFDDSENRIGMGGGYYDRCFSFLRHRKYWKKPKLMGVAFECQKVERISPNIWDVRLYKVISDT